MVPKMRTHVVQRSRYEDICRAVAVTAHERPLKSILSLSIARIVAYRVFSLFCSLAGQGQFSHLWCFHVTRLPCTLHSSPIGQRTAVVLSQSTTVPALALHAGTAVGIRMLYYGVHTLPHQCDHRCDCALTKSVLFRWHYLANENMFHWQLFLKLAFLHRSVGTKTRQQNCVSRNIRGWSYFSRKYRCYAIPSPKLQISQTQQ